MGTLLALMPLEARAADPKVEGEWSPLTTFPVSMTHAHLGHERAGGARALGLARAPVTR